MIKKANVYFRLFASCIPVNGISRASICDLQRGRTFFIPLSLFEIIEECKKYPYHKIQKFYHEEKKILDDYFNFLIENELGFFTDEPDRFPFLNLHWDTPEFITNIIIEIENLESTHISLILKELISLKCKYVELRYYNKFLVESLLEFLTLATDSYIRGITLYIPANSINLEELKEITKTHGRIVQCIIHSSEGLKDSIEVINNTIILTNQIIDSNAHCGAVSELYFVNNISTFTESQHHNTCLNRKISIDVEGNIKNCPSMAQSFGNIRDTTLQEALEHPDFKKYWNVKKDEIAVCKDCEFRHICTDCRAYLENPEDMYSKPLKCGYNPYTAEWEEWSTNPLKEKAIAYYGMQELVKA
jgi:SPASM domain peptide maturase of grasp-with-spasm system